MESEFYNVALDRIRYSLVWEDAETLYNVLHLNPDDHVLVITSAGCNVLNALIKKPATVTAIDINPVQNKLLSLKKHIIRHHDYSTLRGILGLGGKEAVTAAWRKVKSTLPEKIVVYWESFIHAHPGGLVTSGKLEEYIMGFSATLDHQSQGKIKTLLQFTNVEEQYIYFQKELHGTTFTDLFNEYFNDQNLSKGRDPKLFKYAEESGGEAFYSRLVKQISTVLVADNFYFRFFFCGPSHIPEELLPPCYQQKNFKTIQDNLSKLTIITAEAIDYLLSPQGKHINKASLSNIFEYTTHEEFKTVVNTLYDDGNRKIRIVFWNLLHEQGNLDQSVTGINTATRDNPVNSTSCFYFKDVRILDNCLQNFDQTKPATP